MENRNYYFALSLTGIFSTATCHKLIAAAGSASALFQAPDSFFRKLKGLRRSSVEAFLKERTRIDPVKAMASCEEQGILWTTLGDPDYPELLREIHAPPLTLFTKGKRLRCGMYPLAVVGTRRCSHYGRRAVEEITGGLPSQVAVVSGMAAGIDGHAHREAMDQGKETIAVLGTGVDIVYPQVHRPLYRDLLRKGTLVDEFPPGTSPQKHHFPQRNRIISGLSRGVLVVESSHRSGSLITASFALEQGRDVFAVPGSIFRGTCRGTNALIKAGAVPVTGGNDILQLWGVKKKETGGKGMTPVSLTEDEKTVINHLSTEEPVSMEDISADLEGYLPMGRLSAALLGLKMKKRLMELDSRRFVLKNEDES